MNNGRKKRLVLRTPFMSHWLHPHRHMDATAPTPRFDAYVPPPGDDGRTTLQMIDAPPNAFYVWCNNGTDYPKYRAKRLGRTDLQVRSRGWLDHHRATDELRGTPDCTVVIDHAMEPLRPDIVEMLSAYGAAVVQFD